MPEKVQELIGMGAECRALASAVKADAIREQLLEMADQFDRMAKQRSERLRRRHLIAQK